MLLLFIIFHFSRLILALFIKVMDNLEVKQKIIKNEILKGSIYMTHNSNSFIKNSIFSEG